MAIIRLEIVVFHEDVKREPMLPIRTDQTLHRTPYANYVLIGINIVVFLLSFVPPQSSIYGMKQSLPELKEWTQTFILNSARPQIWQFVTYSFLHSGYGHIIGNMFFLYLFGSNVNDRLGNTGYFCFYIAGCIFAGVGYSMFHDTPVLGASGAVSAVTGAYLVLFPRSVITVLYWFVIIGTIEVPALWFILLKMVIIDNIIQSRYVSAPIAYDAHLAGYAFGFIAPLALLWTGMLQRSKSDLYGIISQWLRRMKYKSAIESSNYDPNTGMDIHKVRTDAEQSPQEREHIEKIYNLRAMISALLIKKELDEASNKYIELRQIDSNQVLPVREQLDISNYLMSVGNYRQAADAYKIFIEAYPNYQYIEQIHLMLGIIYARYCQDRELAVKHLELARDGLGEPGQRKMCENELKKLGKE
jgi:membrane associated rhomboid family serine protease